jgi:hypothetical protein
VSVSISGDSVGDIIIGEGNVINKNPKNDEWRNARNMID